MNLKKNLRKHDRFTKRLETTFALGDLKYRGISSDLSETGLFIRTQHGLVPGSVIDIEVYLPNGELSRMRGVVRRTTKAPVAVSSIVKNGMGVELVEMDSTYRDFLRSVGIISNLSPPGQAGEKDET